MLYEPYCKVLVETSQ